MTAPGLISFRRSRAVYFAFVLAIAASSSFAALTIGAPSQVKDINSQSAGADSNPSYLVSVGCQLFFAATDGGGSGHVGLELWKSNNTSAGTVTVKDIKVGGTSSSPQDLTAFGNLVIFDADDNTNGREPWVSDGTAAGTKLLSNIHPGGTGSIGTPSFTVAGSKVFFVADDGTNGRELWVTDGTPGGTSLVKNIDGAGTDSFPIPPVFVALGNKVIFLANDGTNGQEPWVSDGTNPGTFILKDIKSGSSGSASGNFAVSGSKVFFEANDGATHGNELWVTDGTSAGTQLIDIKTGSGDSNPKAMTAFGAGVLFSADDGSTAGRELWFSDGQTGATHTFMVKDIKNGNGNGSDPSGFVVLGSRAVFIADDGSGAGEHGTELWVTDGTSGGTTLLGDIKPGTSGSGPQFFAKAGGYAYYRANDGSHGNELFATDGTTVALIKDIKNLGGDGIGVLTPGNPKDDPVAVGNILLFFADDGTGTGDEVWAADGIPADTIKVSTNLSNLESLTNVCGTVFFQAAQSNGNELWSVQVCPTITLTAPGTMTGTVGTFFTGTFTSDATNLPVTFSETGTLPTGISLSTSGVLSGTPTQFGTFPITVSVVDANGCGASINATLTINCQTITVNPATLSNGTEGVAYPSTQFTQTGAIGGATFSHSGTFPPGMTFTDGTALLTGTPTATGTFTFTVTVTDGNGCTGFRTISLTIDCPTITVTAAPPIAPGTAGTAYPSTQFSQTGGFGTITWSRTGTLPTGMSFSTVTAILSGTPTQVGSFPITITATDAAGCSGGNSFTLVINCPTITVSPSTLSAGTTGTAYPATLFTQTGGIGTITWSETGALPTGMSFISATATLSGTPTQFGSFPITITATDANNCTGSVNPTLVINCPTITVNPSSIPAGSNGVAYSQVFTQTGGALPVTFAKTGTLPTGVTFTPGTATLSGTPTQSGSYPFTITVTDANGCTGSRLYTLSIDCPVITVLPSSIPGGTAGTAYGAQVFTASGGSGSYTFAESGTLPTGITFTPGTATLAGTPTQKGSFPITITATDTVNSGCTGAVGVTLIIGCQTITVSPSSAPGGTAGVAYTTTTFTASNTIGTTTFSKTGTLPTGLTLSSGGVLSGTPTQIGNYPITVIATDGNGCTGSQLVTVSIICPTITVTPTPPITSGTAGVAYTSTTFNQSGGVGTITWSKTGTLPTGMSFNTSSAVLSGTPTQTGSFPITITATDANGCSGGNSFTLVINCPTITVSPSSIPLGATGSAYSVTFSQTGGVGTITWSQTGALPTGISFTPGTATLSGTPTQSGSFPITITATDANGCTGTRNLTLVINDSGFTPIPTFSPFGLMMLALFIGAAGVFALKTR